MSEKRACNFNETQEQNGNSHVHPTKVTEYNSRLQDRQKVMTVTPYTSSMWACDKKEMQTNRQKCTSAKTKGPIMAFIIHILSRSRHWLKEV
ncbi:hypothetical protein AVEN_147657-1 [Araneus ventricosus]|uniref:Uncharacterized protein n=1 Tax=Araneus ventricosus TaxID=182803 RepID=A0A4Y2VZW4_ARAVE|nr:hypothetical protein AVEN_74006-1 [Araneus ventricosus]GBO29845.1 hypothetical protein AVEN_147657-1 [Araneus ventricosus]